MTPAQQAIMEWRIEKQKREGDTEAGIILTRMVYTNPELYGKILDSDLSYYFNELCKKAIAYDESKQKTNMETKETDEQFLAEIFTNLTDYHKSVPYTEGVKCCVDGCENVADYEVILYDYYPRFKETFCEQDYTCPFLCQQHVDINEQQAKGSKAPRETTTYPYTNQHNAQGHSKYRKLSTKK